MDQSADKQSSSHSRLVWPSRLVLVFLISATAPLLGGCQVSYLLKSAYYQGTLLRQRVPIDKALEDSSLSDEQKRKLRLAQEAKAFAESQLGLRPTANYASYTQLKQPYVTYVVSAASRTELKLHQWWFPIIGSVPYKGFFDPEDAKAEAELMKNRGFDTYTRGVSAYSTLGWFNDSILSSMLRYKDHDLVDTIIHETTHATIYIRSQADFNERLAVFIGGIGTREFYRKKEGANGPTLRLIDDEKHDEKLFIAFLKKELTELEKWYADRKSANTAGEIDELDRQNRLRLIQERFKNALRPHLLVQDSYKMFETATLNNAQLMNYRLYFDDQDDFEAVFKKRGSNFQEMLKFCKSLESESDPKLALARAARGFANN